MIKTTTQTKKYRLSGGILMFCLLLIAAAITAQTTQKVEYTYDESGNRTSRKVIVLSNTQSHASAEFVRPTVSELDERKITVYPNPTKGILGIEVKGGDSKDVVSIQVYSLHGVMLNAVKGSVGLTRVDIGDYPAGQYILRLYVGEKRIEYKIIKE